MRGKTGGRLAAPQRARKTSKRTGIMLKVRMGDRLDGGVVPRVRRRGDLRRAGSWAYIGGNRQGLKALHYALGWILRSRSLEIFEGPGYTVIYDRGKR